MIEGLRLIANSDAGKFYDDLAKAINEAQAKNLTVEIQYQYAIEQKPNGMFYSFTALVIGRKQDVPPMLYATVKEE